MRTILDDAKYWFLEHIAYAGATCRSEILAVVVEGLLGETEDLKIGDHVVSDTRPIEAGPASRKLAIRFPQPIAWQVVDESYTTFREEEERDDTSFLQVLSRSAYLDYVLAQHGWFKGPARHYRVWTENDVIDVVATEAPLVEPWTE